MTSPRFVQIHTLHSWPAALLNRDDAGLAKRMPFGSTERIRVSSQCLKRHWRTADDAYALAGIDPAIGISVRSRRVWHVEIEEPLIAEGFEPDLVALVLRALQDGLYGESEAAKKSRGDIITLERGEIVVLGRREIEHLKGVARDILRESGGDAEAAKKFAANSVKERRRNFHALIAGAGIDAAMFGRFVSGDREARVDAAVHVAHALTVHGQASEPDYFTAVDDLQAEEQGSGAGHLNTTELTSGVFYGYVVVDLPLLVANLEGCDPKAWAGADHTLAAKTVEHLLHLVAKITPGAKLGSTAPYAWASLVLAETGDEQPRSFANAFLEPVRTPPVDDTAARTLADHLASMDTMYGAGTRRWLATRHESAAVPEADRVTFPALVGAVGSAIRGGRLMRCLLLRLEGPLMAFGDVAVDEIRPTRPLPTRSMLTGLVANALGRDHCEVEALQRLQERLRFAARAERPGRVVVDFQTAEIAKRDPLWTTRTAPAERAGGEQSYTGPVIRHRHYIADASVCVALTLVPPDERPSLDDVAAALARPARPLFLGRKSCLPAVRILERPPFEARSLVAALGPGEGSVEVDDLESEPTGHRTFTVADLRDWRFGFHTGTRRVREVPRSAGDAG